MMLLITAAILAVCSASWGYVTQPSDRIAFVDLRNLHIRRPRQVLEPPQQSPYQVNEDLDQGYQTLVRNQFQGIPIPIQPYAPIPIRLAQVQEPIATKTQEPQSAAETRPPDFGEYIDFGAHTGDNGGFGWYADYPLNNNHEGGYQHRH